MDKIKLVKQQMTYLHNIEIEYKEVQKRKEELETDIYKTKRFVDDLLIETDNESLR